MWNCCCFVRYYLICESVETVHCFYGMLCAKAKTRRLNSGCSGVLRTPTPQVCRAGCFGPSELVCQLHFDRIRREDDKTCSCLSTWGHSRKLHSHRIPARFYKILDQVGQKSSTYRPGTRWCNLCRAEAHKRFKNWPLLGGELNEVCIIIKCLFKLILCF